MEVYDFVIRQVKITNAKDAVILLLKLLLIAIIADEIYDAIHILPCLYDSRYYKFDITRFIITRALFFTIIYLGYSVMLNFQRKGSIKRASIILVSAGVLILLLNGSFFFIYYIDGPYWGKVIDADTGEPIAGANVMAQWEIDFAVIKSFSTLADVRETVTDSKGRFFLPPARQIWFYPLSDLRIDGLYVYKEGYDSHPPSMQQIWTDSEKEKWKDKLIRLYPNYDRERSLYTNYIMIFEKFPRVYKPTIIKLNRALSRKEQNNAKSGFPSGGFNCEHLKMSKFEKAIGRGGQK